MTLHQRFSEPLFDQARFADELADAIVERGLSYRTASVELGVSHSTLHRIATGRFPPDIETYLRVRLWLQDRGHLALRDAQSWEDEPLGVA